MQNSCLKRKTSHANITKYGKKGDKKNPTMTSNGIFFYFFPI